MRASPRFYYMNTFLRRTLLIALISGVVGWLLFAYLHFSETDGLPSIGQNFTGMVAGIGIGCLSGFALFYTNRLLDKALPWRNYYATRFVAGYVANYAVTLTLTLLLINACVALFGAYVFWNGFSMHDIDLKVKLGILLLAALFIYKVVYALLYSYQHYAVAQIENIQRERKQLELQFEALKSQISPHYLFNSLNTISSLLYKDTPSAEQFIRRLVQTYQYILSTQHKRYVTLQEEIDFVQSYYYLLRIRFQQLLTVEINLPHNIMHTKIPPLTLQILVENAVKHNNLNTDKKLFIYITAQDNMFLKVINTKTGHIPGVPSFRVGLENIQRRYEFFTDKKIEIKDDDKFSVTLPVIHLKTQEHEQKHSA